MITLLKLGGSLITDKTKRATLRPDVVQRLAGEIHQALTEKPDIQLIIGHGSGSFGHFEAREYDTIHGVKTPEQWRGFAKVATVAAALNYHIAQALTEADVPVMRFQPSASSVAQNGVIQVMRLEPLQHAVTNGIVPLVYGDVAFDTVLGGTITSTETIFAYLVQQLPVSRIILLGEVDGVYDQQQQVIPEITPQNFEDIRSALGGSSGVDVTGGMLTKVEEMLKLASTVPYPQIQICNGLTTDLLRSALLGERDRGTMIKASQH